MSCCVLARLTDWCFDCSSLGKELEEVLAFVLRLSVWCWWLLVLTSESPGQ